MVGTRPKPDGRVIIAVPRAAVAAMVLWIAVLESFGIGAIAEGHYAGGLLLLAVWWPFLIPTLLSLRDEVRVDDGWLVARGWVRERRWRRDDVRGVMVERPYANVARLVVETRDGKLTVLPGTTGGPWLWDRTRRRRQLDELEQWIRRDSG